MNRLTPKSQLDLLIPVLLFAFLSPGLAFAQDEGETNDEKKNPDRAAIVAELGLSKEQADAISIAMDVEGPIFVYGSIGGGMLKPANDGATVQPKLQLFADGKLIAAGGMGSPSLESQFDESQLIRFLNFVINENDFYQLDSDDIASRVKGKGDNQLMDAGSSVFTVKLQKGEKSVSVYALWNAIKEFPDFEEVQRVGAIEKQCNSIVSKIHLGGDEEEVLKLVNEKVAELNLGLQPFAVDEMRLANRSFNGRFQVSFERKLPGVKVKRIAPSTMHAIYFKKDKDTEATVKFYGLPVKK